MTLTLLTDWHWLALGFALLGLELLVPGTFCMWISFAAFATGLVVFAASKLSWQTQLLVFAALSVVAVVAWFRLRPKALAQVNHGLNQRGQSHIGQVFTLSTAMMNGSGKVRIADSEWRVQGPELAAGQRVRVLSISGNTLMVEAAGTSSSSP